MKYLICSILFAVCLGCNLAPQMPAQPVINERTVIVEPNRPAPRPNVSVQVGIPIFAVPVAHPVVVVEHHEHHR